MTKLRTIRETRRLTQVQLAKRAGISSHTISNIENGRTPRHGTMLLILRALGLRWEDRSWVF